MRPGILAGFLASIAVAIPLAAQEPAPPAPPAEPQIEITETIDLDVDRTERMTVPVNIGGRGPYSFIVDTGSERTVISRELAQRLGLDAGQTAIVFSMTEASRIDTVIIPALEVGQRTINDIHAPALSRSDLGAEGMLGVDSLRSQRVELDFVRKEMTVTPSLRPPERPWPRDAILVTGRSRNSHLIITDASLDGEHITVIVDTGAQVSVGNGVLRRRLERRRRLGVLRPIELLSVTGGRLDAQYGTAREIQIGGAGIRNIPIAFADVHPFRQLGLDRRPAILLGMDALRLFDRVSFDFARREVRFLLPDSSEVERDIRVAQAEAPPTAQALALSRPAAR